MELSPHKHISSSSINSDEDDQSSTMVQARRVLPKEEEDGNSPPLQSILPTRAGKRRCVSSACIPCRKRKSKCDGASPACSTCNAVYKTTCAYDFDGDHRRKNALKRDIEQLKEKNDSLEEKNGSCDFIVAAMRSASDSEVGDIVNHIREHGSLADIATSIKESRPGPLTQSLETDLSDMVDQFRVSIEGELGYGQSWCDESSSPRENRIHSGPWTKVTSDPGFITELLTLYFTWNHPSYVLFSKSCFWEDMQARRPKYCSSLLVNVIFALASRFSDRPEARADPLDPASAGDHFFSEAKRILAVEGDIPSLTTVQSLALMSLYEAGCGRDSSGWMYSGRAFRMAMDMKLNLPLKANMSRTEIEVRKITFWGCFTIDKMWSSFLGRIPQLPSSSVGVEKPNLFPTIEFESWQPVSNEPPQPYHVQAVASRFCEVSEILGDILSMLFAPKERVTLSKLKALYTRLRVWHAQLPAEMEAKSKALPSVLGLHIYYHSTLLLLFRPFFKRENRVLGDSPREIRVLGDSPREICCRAANEIISLSTEYRRVYSLRQTVIHIPQIISGAAVILLMDLPSPSPSQSVPPNLVCCLKDLRELSVIWQWCNLTLQHIGELAKKWNIDLPREALSAISPPRPLSNHDFNIPHHVNHEFPNPQYHYARPRSENPSDIMVNQPGTWLGDEEYTYVSAIIPFPPVGYEEWTLLGP